MPPMMVSAHLVHAESGRRVVEVRACDGDRLLGSALGEAADAEAAEDRARQRLLARLLPAALPPLPPLPTVTPGSTVAAGAAPAPATTSPAATASNQPRTIPSRRPEHPAGPLMRNASDIASAGEPLKLQNHGAADDPGRDQSEPITIATASSAGAGENPSGTGQARGVRHLPAAGLDPGLEAGHDQPPGAVARGLVMAEEPPADPEDWSSDLAALELHLRRLGWDREQEALYLRRAFGHPSRNRLTNYGDLQAYLSVLDQLAAGSDPATAALPLRRCDLLQQCDALLGQLGWNADQGRALLERELQAASRQQLNDQQLLLFNMLLESEILKRDQVVPSPDQITVVP